jgi:hypothetical protein
MGFVTFLTHKYKFRTKTAKKKSRTEDKLRFVDLISKGLT